jgi:hypothetical protein
VNKRISIVTIFLRLLLVPVHQLSQSANLTLPKDTPVEVCFSPSGGCTDSINKALGQGRQEILVQAYSFTSAPDMTRALLRCLIDRYLRELPPIYGQGGYLHGIITTTLVKERIDTIA